MITVYAIKSHVNGDIYVGMSKDVERRLNEHNQGNNRYTKGLRPWSLIYQEQQPSWSEARVREKYLKSGIGKEFLKKMVS
jgi:predicted GIY-YIG superfamily endonuclease